MLDARLVGRRLNCVPLPLLAWWPWQVAFSGWARMAHLIDKFAVTEVRKPKVGENKPAAATGGSRAQFLLVL